VLFYSYDNAIREDRRNEDAARFCHFRLGATAVPAGLVLRAGDAGAGACQTRAEVQASDDGTNWRHVADMPKAAQLQRFVLGQLTMSFPPATARYFRVVLSPAPALPASLYPHVFSRGAVRSEAPTGAPLRSRISTGRNSSERNRSPRRDSLGPMGRAS
jgi:hypothetical protein